MNEKLNFKFCLVCAEWVKSAAEKVVLLCLPYWPRQLSVLYRTLHLPWLSAWPGKPDLFRMNKHCHDHLYLSLFLHWNVTFSSNHVWANNTGRRTNPDLCLCNPKHLYKPSISEIFFSVCFSIIFCPNLISATCATFSASTKHSKHYSHQLL